MQPFLPTLILRHRKENLKKCSLRGLETKKDIQFLRYPTEKLPSLKGYILLSMEGEVLSKKDADQGILLLDGTWRYATKMHFFVTSHSASSDLVIRTLPKNLRTAYPRRQEDCLDPSRGLASIEALAAAYALLGREFLPLLDHYHWKNEFLNLNRDLLLC